MRTGRRCAWRAGLLGVTLASAGVAAGAGAAAADPADGLVCRQQAAAVERSMGLPPGLLLAVGRVESGRTDAATNQVQPWPWIVDDEGVDHNFASAFDAIAYVVAARARGSRSLDVGCFQVNLQYHPDAFATLADAFDPAANARYAGQMLTEFHARTGSWEKAVEWYHSATPWRGQMYRDLVLSRWTEARFAAPRADGYVPSLSTSVPQGSAVPPPAMPEMLAVRPATRSLAQVQSPAGPSAAAAATPPPAATPRGRRLPRVIVPTVYANR